MSDLLISRFLPADSLREVDHVAVAALPERAWCVARAVDLARMPFVRWLSEARILPDRIAAFLRGRQQPVLESIGVASIERSHGPGFMLLGEEPGREVVVGAVGPFWRPRIEWAEVKPETFAAFNEPGWARLRIAKARRGGRRVRPGPLRGAGARGRLARPHHRGPRPAAVSHRRRRAWHVPVR